MKQKFTKKHVEIEAIQWSGNSNIQEIDEFVGRELKTELESETAYVAGKGAPIFSLLIETKEGVMKAFKGDWIIKEPFPTGDRDFYPCKNDIFIKTYDLVSDVRDTVRFSERDVDISYLCGVFNVSGLSGLAKELKRLKEIGKEPHDIINACRNQL